MGARHKLTQDQRHAVERAAKGLGISPPRGQAIDPLAELALTVLVLERRHIAARIQKFAGDLDKSLGAELAKLQHELAQGRS